MSILLRAVAGLGAAALILNLAAAQEPSLGWSILHDGGANQNDEGVAVLFAADGHPVVGGMRTATGSRSDILVRKLDRNDGSVLWTHVYADPQDNNMVLADLVLDHRGDLLVAGYLSACDG